MPTNLTAEQLAEWKRVCESATPGPWAVWDGPKYCGGGADLCIATGDGSDEWLANMDHRWNHFAGSHNHHEDNHAPDAHCDICSFSDDITEEQRATAAFIATARTAMPALIAEVERLRAENVKLKKAANRAWLHKPYMPGDCSTIPYPEVEDLP